jgi:hypothetical protein
MSYSQGDSVVHTAENGMVHKGTVLAELEDGIHVEWEGGGESVVEPDTLKDADDE